MIGIIAAPASTAGATAAVAILAFAVYRFVLYPAFLSPLSRIPNAHWSAPFSRLWILWVRFVHRENRTLHRAHGRLGPVVRVGPNELSINDLDSVRAVYQGGGFEKPVWYSLFDNYGYEGRASKQHKAPCLHTIPKGFPACSRPVQQQSTRPESG